MSVSSKKAGDWSAIHPQSNRGGSTVEGLELEQIKASHLLLSGKPNYFFNFQIICVHRR